MQSSARISGTETSQFFYTIIRGSVMCGLPNFWIADIHLPRPFASKAFAHLVRLSTFCFWIFISAEIGALFTQNDLNEKQSFDLLIFSTSHPLLYAFWATVAHYKDKVREIIFRMCTSREMYNDLTVEAQMLRKAKLFSIASVLSCAVTMVSYAFDGVIQVIRSDMSFTTVITAWPDVKDMSKMANMVRALSYVTWWILVCRTCAAYVIVISMTICLSHQYKNLQSYFYNLNAIFLDKQLNQHEKEEKYEMALKYGIKMHSESLQCTQIVQQIFGPVYSGQITMNIIALIILMLQMVASERTLLNALAIVSMSSAVLSTTGIFMCNAGDITIEASLLPTAIYSSGWHNCRGTANKRVRKLLLLAMTQGQYYSYILRNVPKPFQKPVVLKAFNLIELSYQSFLSIVKSSYSVFSVLY